MKNLIISYFFFGTYFFLLYILPSQYVYMAYISLAFMFFFLFIFFKNGLKNNEFYLDDDEITEKEKRYNTMVEDFKNKKFN